MHLDVQSVEPNAFDQEDINILTALADQVSIAIQNARQHAETQKSPGRIHDCQPSIYFNRMAAIYQKPETAGIRHTGARTEIIYAEKEKVQKENPIACQFATA